MAARKKFRLCGHINYGKTCPRCKEADRVEIGYTTKGDRDKTIRAIEPDPAEAERLRLPLHDTAKRRKNNFPSWK